MDFPERFALVAGPHLYAWGERHGFHKATIQGFTKTLKPQRRTLLRLVEATGIPEDWWLKGEGPPPVGSPGQEQIQAAGLKVQAPPSQNPYLLQMKAPGSQQLASNVNTIPALGANGQTLGLNAQVLSPSVGFAARALLVLQRQEWLPDEIDDTLRSHMIQRLFNMLLLEAASDNLLFDRLVESDAALESALRYLWEIERCRRAGQTSWNW